MASLGRSPWALHQRVLKRTFDLVVAALALAVLAAPLLILALAIRIASSGPAIFRQRRVGRWGRPFRIWKFRTMVDGAIGPSVTAAGDSRVTPLGQLLRRAKLDELPQLVNVLLGDMSFVGPRPEVPQYVERYTEEQRLVLAVRPGITDLASISFRNEEELLAQFPDRERAYPEVVLPQKLELARRYIRSQSLCGDLRLILHTLAVVVRPRETIPRGVCSARAPRAVQR